MKEINREELIPGKLYYIERLTYDKEQKLVVVNENGKNVGVFLELEVMGFPTNWFNAVFHWFPASKMKNVENIQDIEYITKYKVSLNCMFRFYELQKFDIQHKLETRAIELHLRNITGEKFIMWL